MISFAIVDGYFAQIIEKFQAFILMELSKLERIEYSLSKLPKVFIVYVAALSGDCEMLDKNHERLRMPFKLK